jgi:dimethylargininase
MSKFAASTTQVGKLKGSDISRITSIFGPFRGKRIGHEAELDCGEWIATKTANAISAQTINACASRNRGTAGMNYKAYEFNAAIVRRPARTVTAGLRAVNRGDPTYEGVSAEHDAYVDALRQAGVEVEVLEPSDAYPDSIFVEDPALVFTAGAILLRPGSVSREGEAELMEPVLQRHFQKVLRLPRGYVDGGDVLRTPGKVMIGLSARTNREGAEALVECLAELGETSVIVKTPDDVLHLKSDCSLLDDDTIVLTQRLSSSGVFSGFRKIVVPQGEEAAANALRVNDRVFVGDDYAGTIALLREAFYKTVPLRTTEIRKIDAGLSCMSLRWHK